MEQVSHCVPTWNFRLAVPLSGAPSYLAHDIRGKLLMRIALWRTGIVLRPPAVICFFINQFGIGKQSILVLILCFLTFVRYLFNNITIIVNVVSSLIPWNIRPISIFYPRLHYVCKFNWIPYHKTSVLSILLNSNYLL